MGVICFLNQQHVSHHAFNVPTQLYRAFGIVKAFYNIGTLSLGTANTGILKENSLNAEPPYQ